MASGAPAASRPLGVAILAILIGIYGFFVFLLGIFVLLSVTVAGLTGAALPYTFAASASVVAIVAIVWGLIVLALAVGLWHLRMWALVLTLLFLAFEMVLYGLAGHFVSFGFIVSLLLFVYLLAVSRHF